MTQIQEAFSPQEFAQLRPDEPATLEAPQESDGVAVHNLIRRSAFLDDNSLYCYLLLCTHFASTSVVARISDEVAGVITAYIPPEKPETIFIWQVAVAKTAQRRGLARQMLDHILARDHLRHIRWLETTVTSDNDASRALFSSLARRHGCDLEESVMFDRTLHFNNLHDSEHRLRIGPLQQATSPAPERPGS